MHKYLKQMSLYQQLIRTEPDKISAVIARNNSWTAVCKEFGAVRGNDSRMLKFLREFAKTNHICIDHFQHHRPINYGQCKFTEEQLRAAIERNTSWIAVMEAIGLSPGTTVKVGLQKKADALKVSTAHLTGIRRHHFQHNQTRWTVDTAFQLNSPICKTSLRRLAKKHIEYKCAFCNNSGVWNERPLVLDLDHINGNNKDHRLENLRFLCPNCHSQTPTYKGKNK